MSGVGLTFGFDDHVITQHLARLVALQASKFAAVRTEIGETMKADVTDNLEAQTLFDGSPMPQSKAAIKRRGKTLVAGYDLEKSYTYVLEGLGVAVGSISDYAAIHHFGGDTGRGHKVHLPPRPVLGVGPRQERAIGDFLIAAIRAVQ